MKKLLTILLSVLCLFSVIGMNVSADDTPEIIINNLAIFSGETPEECEFRQVTGDDITSAYMPTYGDVFAGAEYGYYKLTGTYYTLIKKEEALNYNDVYLILFNKNSPITKDTFSPYYVSKFNKNGGIFGYYEFEKVESGYDVVKTGGTEALAAGIVLPSTIKDYINNVVIKGINISAGEKPSTMSDITIECTNGAEKDEPFNVKVVDCLDCMYIDADKYDNGKGSISLNECIVENTLAYGKRYYVVFSLRPEVKLSSQIKSIVVNAIVDGEKTKLVPKTFELLSEDVDNTLQHDSLAAQYSKTYMYIEQETKPDQKSVTLKYSVGETYEWLIKNNINTDVTNKEIWIGQNVDGETITNTEVNVEVKNLNLNKGNILTITVDSLNIESPTNDDFPYYKMITDEGREAKYQIKGTSSDKDEIWKDNNETVVVNTTEPTKQIGIFSWIDDKGDPTTAPTSAGLYQDMLTFTASIEEESKYHKVGKIVSIDFSKGGGGDFVPVYNFYDEKGEFIATVDKDFVSKHKEEELQKILSEKNPSTYTVDYNGLKFKDRGVFVEVATTEKGEMLVDNDVEWGGWTISVNPWPSYETTGYGNLNTKIILDANAATTYIFTDARGGNNTVWSKLKNMNNIKYNGHDDWYIPVEEEVVKYSNLEEINKISAGIWLAFHRYNDGELSSYFQAGKASMSDRNVPKSVIYARTY